MIVVQHTVCADGFVANAELYLVGQQSRGIALMFGKIMDEMLADPIPQV